MIALAFLEERPKFTPLPRQPRRSGGESNVNLVAELLDHSAMTSHVLVKSYSISSNLKK
jgi:hypothetical protein